MDDRLEEVESLLGNVWGTLAYGFAPLSWTPLRKGLALFVSLMHLRNPEVRDQLETIHKRFVDLYESGPMLPDGTPMARAIEVAGQVHEIDPSGWHEYRSWSKDDHDRFFASFIRSEASTIAELLFAKRWSVVFAEEDAFITTDRPVALQHLSSERYGFATSGSVVTFPLSPTRFLVMDDKHDEPRNPYYRLKDGAVGGFNFTTWHGASRFLVTGRPVEEVLTEICAVADQYERHNTCGSVG